MGNWGYNLILIGLITLLLTLSVPNKGMILKFVGLPSPTWEEITDDKKQGDPWEWYIYLPISLIFYGKLLVFFLRFFNGFYHGMHYQ